MESLRFGVTEVLRQRGEYANGEVYYRRVDHGTVARGVGGYLNKKTIRFRGIKRDFSIEQRIKERN